MVSLPRNKKSAAAVLLIAVSALALFSCDTEEERVKERKYGIDRVFRRGPVDFRVAVSEKEINIAQRLDLLLETSVKEGYSASLPSFGEKLERFGIVDYRTFQPELGENGKIITRRRYRLEPFLSGEYIIPPMEVEFHAEGDTTRHVIESDSIKVTVTSLLEEDKADLKIRDIASPVGLPGEFPLTPVLIGAAVVIAAAVILLIRVRRRKQRVVPPPAAHEVALARLQRLIESGLADKQRYVELTVEISDILRHYIEDRFGLRAPERTTEEFLEEARAGLNIGAGKKEVLERFMRHCDLVKFAAFQPTSDDVQCTFDSCRDFIEATRIEKEVNRKAATGAAA